MNELLSNTPFVMAEQEYPIAAVWGIKEIMASGPARPIGPSSKRKSKIEPARLGDDIRYFTCFDFADLIF